MELARSTDSPTVVEALVLTGLATSKAEARRLIRGGGARVNDIKVLKEDATLPAEDFDASGNLKLSAGKKKHVVLRKRPDRGCAEKGGS